MPNRTPSFIVVGLVIIMFLLGFFYMSCSSTTAELRQTLVEFEERIRTLTMKNSENEKKIESFNVNKRELEDEKLNIQKQMEKKDAEINDLNTKFNEKISELESFKSDKQVLEEQLKEFKNISDTLISKNFAIEKVQQDYDKQINDLKQQIENYKQQLNKSKSFINVVHERLQGPLNNLLFNNKLLKYKDINNVENAQTTVNLTSILHLNETNIANNHEQLQLNKNEDKQNNNQGEVNVNKEV